MTRALQVSRQKKNHRSKATTYGVALAHKLPGTVNGYKLRRYVASRRENCALSRARVSFAYHLNWWNREWDKSWRRRNCISFSSSRVYTTDKSYSDDWQLFDRKLKDILSFSQNLGFLAVADIAQRPRFLTYGNSQILFRNVVDKKQAIFILLLCFYYIDLLLFVKIKSFVVQKAKRVAIFLSFSIFLAMLVDYHYSKKSHYYETIHRNSSIVKIKEREFFIWLSK